MAESEWRCEACGGVFLKAWTDEEALAEALALGFTDDLVPICDPCYLKMMAWRSRQVIDDG